MCGYCIWTLYEIGTDVSTLDNHGRNPLHLAQSKLKLIASSKQQPTEDAIKVKMEVQQIIEMMLEYLQKKGQDVEAELLNAFANRLTLSQTPDEVDADVQSLLANLSSLTLSTGGGGRGGVRNACAVSSPTPVVGTALSSSSSSPSQGNQVHSYIQPPKFIVHPSASVSNIQLNHPLGQQLPGTSDSSERGGLINSDVHFRASDASDEQCQCRPQFSFFK